MPSQEPASGPATIGMTTRVEREGWLSASLGVRGKYELFMLLLRK